MQHDTSNRPLLLIHRSATRRGGLCWTARFAAGTAAAAFPAARWAQAVQAEDDSVILIAGDAEISARPGSAIARGAAAEAAAASGAARVQAAAALAEANSDDGAIAQGAVAMAAADPDVGAVAQGAAAVASASSEDDGTGVPVPDVPQVAPKVITPTGRGGGGGRRIRGGGGRARVRGGGGRTRGAGRGGRRMRAGVGGAGVDRERRRDRLASLPSAGIGLEQPSPLTSFLAMASAAAAAGAVILRGRGESVQPAEAVTAIDN